MGDSSDAVLYLLNSLAGWINGILGLPFLRYLAAACVGALTAWGGAGVAAQVCKMTLEDLEKLGEPVTPAEITGARRFALPRTRWVLTGMGAGFGLLAAMGTVVPVTALFYSTAVAMLAVMGVVDAYTRLLPDELTLGLVWLGLLAAAMGLTPVSVGAAVAAAALAYGLFRGLDMAGQRIYGHPVLGGGDAKLAAGLAAWAGLQDFAMMIIIGSLLIVGIAAQKRLEYVRGRAADPFVPYGPGLVMAGILFIMIPDLGGRLFELLGL